ncbi:MAG TPA: hypothetical protein VHM89_12965 [Acidimicrobiales bacterium]|nr:hypothetical protein [Acidimicrobiales bacterium]
MTERYTAREDHPVMTMAGIMPGGSEMKTWYNHVPFPTPEQLEVRREELLGEIEAWKAEKALTQAGHTTPEITSGQVAPTDNAA